MTSPLGRRRVRFGNYEFDSATGELFNGERTVKLQPQPVRVLERLVSCAGELVTRDELRQALWPDGTSVEFDQGLNFCIRQIRAALADSATEPRYLETLPKRGYRFIAPIIPVERDKEPEIPAEPPPAPQRPFGIRLWLIVGGIAVTMLLSVYWLKVRGNTPKSIVVRPFETLGFAPEQAWYGDALTQQLIAALVRTKEVRVLPWSTSVALKGQAVRVQELGRRFGVDAILEGSVRRAGDNVKVMVQLVDARSEGSISTVVVDRSTTDLASVENEIMSSIAETLRFQIRGQDIPAARRPPEDGDTYNLYLKAASAEQNSRSLKSAADAFEEVIRRAPRFAPAYAGLANVWARSPEVRAGSRRDTVYKAVEAARRAIDLDPSSSEGHAALAHAYFHLRKWPEAEGEFQIALGLDPDSASTLQIYAVYLAIHGRFNEALQRAETAARLAPASRSMAHTISLVHFYAGNYDEAIAAARRTLEFDGSSGASYHVLMRAYATKGMFQEASAAVSEIQRLEKSPQSGWRAYLLARSGQIAESKEILRQWDARNPGRRPPFPHALALIECGETDRGFEALRTVLPGGEGAKIWMRHAPELRKWRGDPRFAAAVAAAERLNLE